MSPSASDPRPTGRQLAAARALAGLTVADLAQRSGIDAAELDRLEQAGPAPVTAPQPVLARIGQALRAQGVELVHVPAPGVRLAGAAADEAVPVENLTAVNDT